MAAQNKHDSAAFVRCFSETGVVYDEGRIYIGKKAIRQWIENANQQYKTVIDPVSFAKTGTSMVLTVGVSGTFPQSPLILKYYFMVAGGRIQSLKIAG